MLVGVVAIVLWGASSTALPPMMQAAIRCIGATVLLMLWCRWRGIALFARDGSLRAGLLVGALFAGEFACIYLGLQYTAASRLTVFLYTSPFWVAALVPLFVHSERLRRLQWLGLACAFVAVVFALREGLGDQLQAFVASGKPVRIQCTRASRAWRSSGDPWP